MAQDLGLDIQAGPSVSGLFGSNITAGNSQTSNNIDLTGGSGNVVPGEIGVDIKIVTGTGTPAGNKQWVVKALWSFDGTNHTDADLAPVIACGTIAASAPDHIKLAIPVEGKGLKIHVDNDQSSGPDITSSSAISVYDVHGDQA